MSYQDYEIEISQSQLSEVFSRLDGMCLIGGWAVYITVNKNFNDSQGRNYIGSRDIDLGFHVDRRWSESQLRDSLFAKTIRHLEDAGFRPLNFRLVKYFHTETRRELDWEQAKKLPQHMMFDHYVDPIVDNIHPDAKKLLGFVPIDEPLLSHVFKGRKYTMMKAFGGRFMLPRPEVLLATKINSVPNRDKEHKRIKDIADIYALLWHSGVKISLLKKRLLSVLDASKVAKVISSFGDEDYAGVSKSLGVDRAEISRVIRELA